MGADGNIQTNLFLPFGKVRMGCPLGEGQDGLPIGGRLGWVILRGRIGGGWKSAVLPYHDKLLRQ